MTHPTIPPAIALTGGGLHRHADAIRGSHPHAAVLEDYADYRRRVGALVPWPGGGHGGPQSTVHGLRGAGLRTGLRTGDYSEIGPVLSPSLSVVTSSLSSIATSRLAIGVFLG